MKITQIRNATQVINYAGVRFLIDPMLAKKDAYPGFARRVRSNIRIPMVDLPLSLDKILDVDAVIVTHTHLDHMDTTAYEVIPKDMPVFLQNTDDENIFKEHGFTNLTILCDKTSFKGIHLIKTKGQHGNNDLYNNPQLAKELGKTCGVVFISDNEEPLYICGDTILIDAVKDTMVKYQPKVVIMNTGFAHALGYGSINCGLEDILTTHRILPNSMIVCTHMEAINHCLVTRKNVIDYAKDNEISEYVFAPKDGETVVI